VVEMRVLFFFLGSGKEGDFVFEPGKEGFKD